MNMVGMRCVRAGLAFTWLLAAGCGGGGEDATPVDCSGVGASGSWNSNVKTFVETHCTRCHSASSRLPFQRNGAPADVNFDTYADAKSNAAAGARAVADGKMPPQGGAAELSTTDRCVLQAWVNAGTPE